MQSMSRFLVALLLTALLLAACNLPQETSEQIAPTNTAAGSSPSAVPSLTRLPEDTPTSAPPTPEPEDVQAPEPSATRPVPPPGPILGRLTAGQEPVFTLLKMFDPLSGWGIGGSAGASDHIFTTRDGGNTWRDITPPQPGNPNSLEIAAFFQDASTGWVTFSSLDTLLPAWPVVWRTVDAGQTWQASQPLDLTDLSQAYSTDLFFADMQHGWLLTHVGAGMSHDYVTLYRTIDGGLTWDRLLDPYNDGQIQICQKTGMLFLDSQVGWLTGDCGGVMAGAFLNRTEDGGTTWTYIDLPAPAEDPLLFDVNRPAACGSHDLHFFEPQMIVLGVRCTLYDPNSTDPTFANYIYTTLDDGATWNSMPYPGGTLLFVSSQNGWALAHEIYQTADGGATWTLANNVHWDAHFNFISPLIGWAASFTKTEFALVGTTDGGAHWFMMFPVIAP
jgi:photosystem II stability/assembly factor-like uncharacterized protein